MRIGDIIVNPWVSKETLEGRLNTNYATIYIGNNESLDYKGKKHKWADKVYADNPKYKTPWKVIGHIDLLGIIEATIKDAVESEENDESNTERD